MNLDLKDKVVVVTGASKGIGKAIAKAFAAEGSKLAICARGEEELERAASEMRDAGAEVHAVTVDMTEADEVTRFAKSVLEHFGTVHVLVNNVGGIGSMSPFDALGDDDWQHVLDLNVMSTVRMTREVLPTMQGQGWGRIINIASESGVQPDPVMPHYNASKAAIINLTKSLSKAYAKDGILVNAVSPATIRSPLVDGMFADQADEQGISKDEAEQQFLAENRPHIVLKRVGEPEEVAGIVLLLASAEATFMTGGNIRVDGGSVASMAT